MIDFVFSVIFAALSLAQPDQAAITTNELAPPPGMSSAKDAGTSNKTVTGSKSAQAAGNEKRDQISPENKEGGAIEEAVPAAENAPAPPVQQGTEAAQPTSEEKQAPTQNKAGGSGSPGRIAAFWFILPNRPPANK